MRLFFFCQFLLCFSLSAFENTPWLLPMLEPEMTVGAEAPCAHTFGDSPLLLFKGGCTLLEKDEFGFIAYTRPCSFSLTYERQISNDLDMDWAASSLFIQEGNALPWNDGVCERAPPALLAGARLGCHYFIDGEKYGQIFTSLGLLAPLHNKIQDLFQLGANYAFNRQHRVQMETWCILSSRSARALQTLMMSYTYTRADKSHWTLTASVKHLARKGTVPFLSLSYSFPF